MEPPALEGTCMYWRNRFCLTLGLGICVIKTKIGQTKGCAANKIGECKEMEQLSKGSK